MDSDADKTRMIRRNRTEPPQAPPLPGAQNQQDADPDATRIIQGGTPPAPAAPGNAAVPDDDPTRLLNQPSAARPQEAAPPAGDVDSDKTQLMRRSTGKKRPVAGAADAPSALNDPVTGWLVVIDGPGKGGQVAVGEQDNRVGRGGGDEKPRVCLNFGDPGISRSNAFIIRYDPKKRRFKLLPGEGSNIVYLNGDDLDSPTEIKDGDVIELSRTKLRFTPFCGENFDWADTE